MIILQEMLITVGWTFLAVLLFYGGVRLYDLLDPIDHESELRRGNVAVGLLLSAVIVSLAAIIIAVIIS